MDKFKESAENVSTIVKEKTKQTVQQSQEFIQSEQFQNAKMRQLKIPRILYNGFLNAISTAKRILQGQNRCASVVCV